MAEPNNGMIVDGVRFVVIDLEGPAGGCVQALFRGGAWAPSAATPAELRIYRDGEAQPFTARRFRRRQSALRARMLLAGLVDDDHPARAIEWAGALAALTPSGRA